MKSFILTLMVFMSFMLNASTHKVVLNLTSGEEKTWDS